MEGLFANLFTKEMAILAASAITVMLFVGRIPLENSRVNETKFWKGWGIFILLIICLAGSFIPGIRPEGEVGNVIVFGLLSSLAALLGRAILKPIVMNRLEGKIKNE
jgi:hypothetical protein